MVNEYYGSMIAFFISLLYLSDALRRGNTIILLHIFIIITSIFVGRTALVPFVAGSGLAYLLVTGGLKFQFSTKMTIVLLATSIVGFSNDNWIFNTIASLCVMGALLGNQALAEHLSGRIGSLVGALSFPLYLIHTLVILLLTSYVYAHLSDVAWWSMFTLPLSVAATLVASFVLCIPLVYFDKYWVLLLNKNVKRLRLLDGGEPRPYPVERQRIGKSLSHSTVQRAFSSRPMPKSAD